MALAFNTNIDYTGKLPNFTRDQFKTIAEMAAYSENYLPDTYVSTVVEDGGLYLFQKSAVKDPILGKWRKVGSANLSEEMITAIKVGGVDIDTTYEAGTSMQDILMDMLCKSAETTKALYYGVSNNRNITSLDDLSPISTYKEVSISVQPNNQYVIIAIPNDVLVTTIYDENGLNNTGCFQTYALDDYTVYVSESKVTCSKPFGYKLVF